MHILNSEGTHLDQKLTNYRGPKTSTFHVERPLQRYLLKTVLHRGGIQLWVGAQTAVLFLPPEYGLL